MALTQDEIDYIINPALDRIAAGKATFSPQTDVVTLACIRHYERTRDSLLRSWIWPWATGRIELSKIKTLVLNVQPTSAWAVGDTITGISSGVTADILTVTSPTEYVVTHISGDFADGETITNATVEQVYWEGIPVVDEDGDPVYWWDDSSDSQVTCGTGYPDVDALNPDFDWTYQYQLPSDFVRLIGVQEMDDIDDIDDRISIEGTRILTNYETLSITYVKKITDPTLFEDLFAELLILRLAKKLLNPLAGTASRVFREELGVELKKVEGRARAINSNENRQGGRYNWNNARW